MRLTFQRLGKLIGLPILALSFAGCGGGGGSSNDGGFSNADNTIKVRINAESTTVPANVNGESPSLLRPYTVSVIVEVRRDDGTVFDDGETKVQLAVNGVRHGAVSTLDNPETEDVNEFLVLMGQTFADINSGQAQFFFTSFSEPGTATLTASVPNPSNGRPIAATVTMEVEDVPRGPTAALTFTGPFVNAVRTNAAFLNDGVTILADGSYSRVVSVVANDANGNPVKPATQIDFFLVDSPIVGYPDQGPGSFFIAGNNGNPIEGGFRFDAIGGQLQAKGARPFDRLVLDGQQRTNPQPDNNFLTGINVVQTILNDNQLFIDQQGQPFSQGPDNGATVPYVIGRPLHGAISSPGFTDFSGVASTLLNYPVFRLGQTALLVACATDSSVCTVLNTCDTAGGNCGSVYLGVSNGIDRILTASATSLAPNTTTDVVLCLRDANLAPLPATAINYAVGPTGSATVTVNGSSATPGSLTTGGSGCAVATVTSSGQIEGGPAIQVTFWAEDVTQAVVVTIKSPGAGTMMGNVVDDNPGGLGTKIVELLLLSDDGTPIPDTLIDDSVEYQDEDNACAGYPPRENIQPIADVTYDPPTKLTNTSGRLDSFVDFLQGDNGDVVTVDYLSFGGAELQVKFAIMDPDFLECAEGALKISAFPSQLTPNASTPVDICLEDSKQRPVPDATVTYFVGPTGGAQVTVDGSSSSVGNLTTGADGCVTTLIESSGQTEIGDDIEITFNADNAEEPAVVTIMKLEGVLTGTVAGTTVNLLLVDKASGAPIADSFIEYKVSGDCTAQSVSFVPANQRTDAAGQLAATFSLSTVIVDPDESETPTAKVEFNTLGESPATFEAQLLCPTQTAQNGNQGGGSGPNVPTPTNPNP